MDTQAEKPYRHGAPWTVAEIQQALATDDIRGWALANGRSVDTVYVARSWGRKMEEA